MTRHTVGIALGVGFAALAACSSSTSSGGSGGATSNAGATSAGTNAGGASNQGGAPAAMPDWMKWSACEADEDCTVVPIEGCCGCIDTGVNRTYEKDARASNASFDANACPPLGCATQGCNADAASACEAGRCVAKPGCSARSESDCESDGKCEKYLGRLCQQAGDFAYFACGKPKGACDSALTCRVSPVALQVLFPDGCVPDGYTQPCPSMCTPLPN